MQRHRVNVKILKSLVGLGPCQAHKKTTPMRSRFVKLYWTIIQKTIPLSVSFKKSQAFLMWLWRSTERMCPSTVQRRKTPNAIRIERVSYPWMWTAGQMWRWSPNHEHVRWPRLTLVLVRGGGVGRMEPFSSSQITRVKSRIASATKLSVHCVC